MGSGGIPREACSVALVSAIETGRSIAVGAVIRTGVMGLPPHLCAGTRAPVRAARLSVRNGAALPLPHRTTARSLHRIAQWRRRTLPPRDRQDAPPQIAGACR